MKLMARFEGQPLVVSQSFLTCFASTAIMRIMFMLFGTNPSSYIYGIAWLEKLQRASAPTDVKEPLVPFGDDATGEEPRA